MLIAICGSSKFKDNFMAYHRMMNFAGHAVIRLNVFEHYDNELLSDDVRAKLFKAIIDGVEKSDALFVISSDGNVGEETKQLIQYALEYLHVPVVYSHDEGVYDWIKTEK